MNNILRHTDGSYLTEQRRYLFDEEPLLLDHSEIKPIFFKKNTNRKCIEVFEHNAGVGIETIYFIGVDWLTKEQPIYIEPKLNKSGAQTNYLLMLFKALSHPEVAQHTGELYEIKFEKDSIQIEQKHDLLTPLLAIHFLSIVKEIARKGLKKSYYKVESNLYGKIKGKVLVGKTVKQNHLKNKPLNTSCSYDEFGLNGLENRLLKKSLVFIQRYLPSVKNLEAEKYMAEIFGYIMPVFDSVSEEVDINDIKHIKPNAFYKEYAEGIRLAKMILQRFGYNITNTQNKTIHTPPFWIDMSKLFELYVLGLLKDKFRHNVGYHDYFKGNELDYLLDCNDNGKEYKIVIDAKYRELYQKTGAAGYDIKDIRQISGYARLNKVYEKLKIDRNKLIDCLIIYPDLASPFDDFFMVGDLTPDDDIRKIREFSNFYKLPITLP